MDDRILRCFLHFSRRALQSGNGENCSHS
jgi:hypothetical protein